MGFEPGKVTVIGPLNGIERGKFEKGEQAR
jgi:hypothetical protein